MNYDTLIRYVRQLCCRLKILEENNSGGGSGGDGRYTPSGPTTITVGGISVGTDLGTTPVTIPSILDMMLYPAVAASITLSTPATLLREFGNILSTIILNATTVKHSSTITVVEFFRGGSSIHVQSSHLPNGGLESYSETTPVTVNTSFTAKVTDSTTTVTSNTITVNFVYPIYYGAGASNLSGSQIAALTKLVQGQQNTTTTTSPSTQRYYFAYPAVYPVLTSILDANGFETIGDYTMRTVSITGLDATSQSYRVYEFNHNTTQVSFNNTYKF